MNLGNRPGLCRVYEKTHRADGSCSFRLKDRIVDLGKLEYLAYSKLTELLQTPGSLEKLEMEFKSEDKNFTRLMEKLESVGLLYYKNQIPPLVSGKQFHEDYFSKALPSWLNEAFAHPFWERMTSGRGSARLFSGWMIELYHYTRNANRHMPLSCAYTSEKSLKTLRAKHYVEEWNHYHYFLESLKVLGYDRQAVIDSVPLPMTLALSNFMRQAAREDILAYSICSAVLEGTTTDRETYNPYYEKMIELYAIPRKAISPIYAHLDLDIKYQHSDLFLEILENVKEIPAERASRILNYGHQLVEHIWLWTDAIEKYYSDEARSCPRISFDPIVD